MAAVAPLAEMSPNISESEASGRKRSHDEFDDGAIRLGEEPEAKRPSKNVSLQSASITCESDPAIALSIRTAPVQILT